MKSVVIIQLIILGILSSCLPGKTELIVSSNHVEVNTQKASALFSLQVSDRRYVVSVLKQIFGENETLNEIYWDQVYMNPAFGGTCDPYSSVTGEKQLDTCNGAAQQLSNEPSLDTIRISYTIKTCEQIVKVDDAIKFALSSVALKTTEKPGAASIKKAYHQFYRFKPLSKEVAAKMAELADLKSDPLEAWRLIYLSLCMSPEWQAI